MQYSITENRLGNVFQFINTDELTTLVETPIHVIGSVNSINLPNGNIMLLYQASYEPDGLYSDFLFGQIIKL